jgi:hypothetical protein
VLFLTPLQFVYLFCNLSQVCPAVLLMYCFILYVLNMGTAVAWWLRCCATNQKVAGSIPYGVIGIFHWHNPPDRTIALGSTQPLTEMSTRRISWR